MINIAIDGPAGAGKSTAARLAAAKLGFIYVDTGALYRTVGVAAMRRNIATNDRVRVPEMLKEITAELKFVDGVQHVLLNGEDVSEEIRTAEAGMAASDVSAMPEVRAFLLDLQKNMAKTDNVIMDGRDIGTVVLPNAELKIFLTASPEVRAKRRFDELTAKGQNVEFNELLEQIKLRDKQDSEREVAPLKPAEDSVYLDTSDMTLDEVVDKIVELAEGIKGE
jgi:CMP/dCMP kinase